MVNITRGQDGLQGNNFGKTGETQADFIRRILAVEKGRLGSNLEAHQRYDRAVSQRTDELAAEWQAAQVHDNNFKDTPAPLFMGMGATSAWPRGEFSCWPNGNGQSNFEFSEFEAQPADCLEFNRDEIFRHVSLVNERAVAAKAANEKFDGVLVLSAWLPGAAKDDIGVIKKFKIGDALGMTEAVLSLPGFNIFLPWTIMRPDLGSNQRGGKADVRAVLAAVADFDNDKGEFPLSCLPVAPSYIVESSPGNYHPIFIFPDALTAEAAAPACLALSDFAKARGGDSSSDVGHVWRIPGTPNWPTVSKLKRARVPTMSSIAQDFAGELVSADKLKALAPPRPEKAPWVPTPHTAEAEARCRSLLDSIPAEKLDHDEWVKIVMAVHSTGWDNAEAIADAWSSKDGNPKYNAEMQRYKWASFECDGGVTFGSLYFHAEKWIKLAATATAKELELFNPADFEGVEIPPRKWIVEDYIPDGTVTLLYADGGTGKDYLKLQIAAARAVSGKWIGLDVQPGRTLIISDEDDIHEMQRRLDGIRNFYGVSWADLSSIRLVDRVGEDCVLGALSRAQGKILQTQIYDALDRAIVDFQPGLICLGNLANMFGGAENDRPQATQFVGLLHRLCKKHSVAILVPAHPSLTGMASGSGTSGSTGWHNSVRARVYFETIKDKDGGEDLRTFRGKKNNYGTLGGKFDLTWKDGLFQRLDGPGGLSIAAAEQHAEDVFMTILQRFNASGRNATESPGTSYAPARFVTEPDSAGITKDKFKGAMARLFFKGKIKIIDAGRPSKPAKTIVPT